MKIVTKSYFLIHQMDKMKKRMSRPTHKQNCIKDINQTKTDILNKKNKNPNKQYYFYTKSMLWSKGFKNDWLRVGQNDHNL